MNLLSIEIGRLGMVSTGAGQTIGAGTRNLVEYRAIKLALALAIAFKMSDSIEKSSNSISSWQKPPSPKFRRQLRLIVQLFLDAHWIQKLQHFLVFQQVELLSNVCLPNGAYILPYIGS